ncbi:MAG: SDR family NAD(P)-dependent oxidoreductase, partial [Succinivibrio sp.]
MKRVLVTGSGTGLGKAIAIELAKQGYHVVLHYRNSAEGAKDALAMIKSEGGSASLL